ncbi:MAG: ParB N-terminal domain-containing protein, partial [Clostridiales bacterium]|nr:ParB N-terminal domain-containing protein [Clostridiales bacterium]
MAVKGKKGLGRGLGAYFGDEVVEEVTSEQRAGINHLNETNTSHETENRISKQDDEEHNELKIRISKIEPGRDQPRKQFEEEQLQQLADSIKKYGVFQPLLVKKTENGYEIIAGE